MGDLQLLDSVEADDIIIAVLEKDLVWGGAQEIGDLPQILVERLRHYFGTYKLVPGGSRKSSYRKLTAAARQRG